MTIATQRIAKRIVREILFDLTDRHGLSDEWDQIDEDTQDEIKQAWQTIVERAIQED